jgi:adenylate cyclase
MSITSDGSFVEAAEWAQNAIRLRSGFTAAHRILCASLAQAGRTDEARVALARLRDLQPNVSLEWIKQYVPYTPRAMPLFLEGNRAQDAQGRPHVIAPICRTNFLRMKR